MKNILLLLTIGLAAIGIVGCGGSSDTPPAAPTPSGAPPGMGGGPPGMGGSPEATAAAPEAKPDEAAKTEPVDNSDNPWADDVKTTTVGAIGNAFLGLAPKVPLPVGRGGPPGAMPGGMPGGMPTMPGGAPGTAPKQ